MKYVPTEVVTLYVAAISAGPGLKALFGFGDRLWLYWGFVALTPVVLFALYRSTLRTDDRPLPGLRDWPWWKLVASTIAFGVWALSVPGNPFVQEPLAGAAAGFLAVFVSTLLNLCTPLFEKKAQ